MNNNIDISILGCGWLGFPLAKTLVSKGYCVKGSTTSPSKLASLDSLGISSYLVQFNSQAVSIDLSKFLDSEVLVITVPPGRKNEAQNDNYRQMIDLLTRYLPKSKVKKVILVSSTSVYDDVNAEVNEDTSQLSNIASARLMVHAEQELMKLKNIQVVVLRLSGLIGPDRNPAKFFAGKTNIPNGLAPVNLIHQDDAVSAIIKLVETVNASGIYNASAPSHPSREEFYMLAAKRAGLEAPQFLSEKKKWKIINSTRLTTELTFKFRVDDLMRCLNSDQDAF